MYLPKNQIMDQGKTFKKIIRVVSPYRHFSLSIFSIIHSQFQKYTIYTVLLNNAPKWQEQR